MEELRKPDPAIAAAIGERIRSLRQERRLSQAQLAAASGLGGQASISQIEQGRRAPSIESLYALAEALHIPVASLLDDRAAPPSREGQLVLALLDQMEPEDRRLSVRLIETIINARANRSPEAPVGIG